MLASLPIRGQDKWGNGAFDAPRGNHKHAGVDPACYPGSGVLSRSDGVVTKIGFPYSQGEPGEDLSTAQKKRFLYKKALLYVQVTSGNLAFRYMYISPLVVPGDRISKGQLLGHTVSLQPVYPGITEHFHFEIKENGKIINPRAYI